MILPWICYAAMYILSLEFYKHLFREILALYPHFTDEEGESQKGS